MRDCPIWVDAPVEWFLRQPDDSDDDSDADDKDGDDEKKEKKSEQSAFEKNMIARANKQKRETDRLKAEIKALTDAKVEVEEVIEEKKEEVKADPGDLPAGVKALMSKQQKQLEKIQSQLDSAQKEAVDKAVEFKLERRKHEIEAALGKLNAINSKQAYQIISGDIVEDEEIGDSIKVKTEHGDDYIPVAEYLPTFKDENPHLFAASSKSGSGAGSGSARSTNPKFTTEKLADPKQGGMSWDEYDKNRDAIHQDLEDKAGI